jgi:hypothetical protein
MAAYVCPSPRMSHLLTNYARLVHSAPPYMKKSIKSLYTFFNTSRGGFMDYSQMMSSEASVMLLVMLADDEYKLERN